MDMMQGLINANAPIGQQDVMGGFLQGQKASTDVRKTLAETAGLDQDARAKKYQQDLTEKLQQAIHQSVDPTSGKIDPDKFKVAAHTLGVDPQAIDYAYKDIEKQWETARKVALAKQSVSAVTEGGAKQVQDAGNPTGNKWASKPASSDRGTLSAPAPTSTPEPKTAGPTTMEDVEKDKTGFLTPDMVAPTPSGYKITTTGVEGQGQSASDAQLQPVAPPETSMPAEAPHVPGVIEAIGNMQVAGDGDTTKKFAAATNPLKIADLSVDTQDRLLAAMRQEGTLPQWNAKKADGTPMKRADYIKLAQDAQDAQFARGQSASVVVPTSKMFIDKEGNFDQGAYERAKAEYPAKQAAATQAYMDEVGKKYGTNLAQELQLASNRRAETQLATEQGKIASAGAAVEESTQNINDQLADYDFKPLSPLLVQNADAGQKQALKDGAKAFATVAELSRRIAKEKRNPTVAEVNGATNQIMALDGMGSNLSNEQKVSALANRGFLDKLYASTLGEKPAIEAIQSAVAQTLMARATGGESLEDMARNTSYVKLHNQFEGRSKAFAGPGWTRKPAKPAPAAKGRKAGESMSDYYRRVGK